jgi:hypothetical protein
VALISSTVMGWIGLVGIPAAIAAGIAVWIVRFSRDLITEKAKAAIKAEYDQRLESFKAALKASGDVELERRKHELALAATKHNVRYAKLHELRAATIGEVYAALSDCYYALRAYTAAFEPAGGPSKEVRLTSLQETLQRFRTSFLPRKIYLPKAIADRLDEIFREIFSTKNAFLYSIHVPPRDPQQTQRWLEIGERVDGPVTDALTKLEAELRRLMGDDLETEGPVEPKKNRAKRSDRTEDVNSVRT